MKNYNHKDLIQQLTDCVSACEHCATACLSEKDVTMLAQCITLDRDCADICRQATTLLLRDSPIALQYLLLCEEICRMCAKECAKHSNMKHCKVCAETCKECADACHKHHEPITQS